MHDLLVELVWQQERRCQLLDEMVALKSPSSVRRENYNMKTVTSSPTPAARRFGPLSGHRLAGGLPGTVASSDNNKNYSVNTSPNGGYGNHGGGTLKPSSDRYGSYSVPAASSPPSNGHFGNYAGETGNRAKFEKGMVATSSPRLRASGSGAAKKVVRFLDDVSVLGGSAESIGSLLDSHVDLHETAEDIDALITSLTSCDSFADAPALELRDPAAIMKALKSPMIHSGSDPVARDKEARRRVQDLVDTLISAEVVDQPKNIVHLEPDDPNSIDSGSVLSELDFDETLSNITVESCKTNNSVSSPISQTTATPSR